MIFQSLVQQQNVLLTRHEGDKPVAVMQSGDGGMDEDLRKKRAKSLMTRA